MKVPGFHPLVQNSMLQISFMINESLAACVRIFVVHEPIQLLGSVLCKADAEPPPHPSAGAHSDLLWHGARFHPMNDSSENKISYGF